MNSTAVSSLKCEGAPEPGCTTGCGELPGGSGGVMDG